MKTLKTSKLIVLTILGVFPALPALPRDPYFVIIQPGYPGSTAEAENFIQDLAGELSKLGGPENLRGSYYNETKAALQAIEEKDPAFGIVSLGFFLAHEKKFQLEPVLESRPLARFYLVVQKGEPVQLQDLAGKEVAGTPFHEMEFVRRILFGAGAGGGPVSPGEEPPSSGAEKSGGNGGPGAAEAEGNAPGGETSRSSSGPPGKPVADVTSWKVEAANGFSRGVRNVAKGRVKAALLTARECEALQNLKAGNELEICYRTEELPVALMVSFGKEGDATRKGAKALAGLKDSPSGKELITIMGIEGFTPVDLKRLGNLTRRYQQGGAPGTGKDSPGGR